MEKNTASPKGVLFTEIVLDIFKLNGLLINEGDALTKSLGLTSARWKVLGALAMSTEPVSVAQISRMMGQSRQGVQRIANEMAHEGIVAYKDNPEHKRAKLVIITAKGQKIYQKLMQIQTPWANESVAEFDQSGLETAHKVIKKLIQKFELNII